MEFVQKHSIENHLADDHALIECEDCGEEIDKYFLKKNQEEDYKIPCEKCKVKIVKSSIKKHLEEECIKRVIRVCPYCEMELFADSPSDHVGICGSGTNVCSKCGKRVILKNMLLHIHSFCMEHCLSPVPPSCSNNQPEPLTDGARVGQLRQGKPPPSAHSAPSVSAPASALRSAVASATTSLASNHAAAPGNEAAGVSSPEAMVVIKIFFLLELLVLFLCFCLGILSISRKG